MLKNSALSGGRGSPPTWQCLHICKDSLLAAGIKNRDIFPRRGLEGWVFFSRIYIHTYGVCLSVYRKYIFSKLISNHYPKTRNCRSVRGRPLPVGRPSHPLIHPWSTTRYACPVLCTSIQHVKLAQKVTVGPVKSAMLGVPGVRKSRQSRSGKLQILPCHAFPFLI
jgi:hypothetical protein